MTATRECPFCGDACRVGTVPYQAEYRRHLEQHADDVMDEASALEAQLETLEFRRQTEIMTAGEEKTVTADIKALRRAREILAGES